MELQTSLAFTTCSLGGCGVAVGAIVGSIVAVGVFVLVGVNVMVGVAVGVVTLPVPWRIRNTNAAPKPSTRMINPIAAGRLSFNSGSFGACTGLEGSVFLGLVENDLPHTRQRVAFSLRRVPQVGHTRFVEDVCSGLIFPSILFLC